MADVLTRFKAGDAVPDWLLVVEPKGADSWFGHIRFAIDADVVDLPDYFLLQPKAAGTFFSVFDIRCHNCHIAAASRPVWASMKCEVIMPPEVNAAGLTLAQIAAYRQPDTGVLWPPFTGPSAPLGEQVRRGDRWGRFLRSFFGRPQVR